MCFIDLENCRRREHFCALLGQGNHQLLPFFMCQDKTQTFAATGSQFNNHNIRDGKGFEQTFIVPCLVMVLGMLSIYIVVF